MTTLQTTDGALIKAHPDAPRQLTRAGRRSLPTSSVPLRSYESHHVQLISAGGQRRVVSYAQLYASQPWVFTVANKLARTMARVPLKVYELDSQNDRRRVTSGPLVDLLSRPLPRRGPVNLKQWMALPVLVHGNALLAKVRREPGGPPTGLLPLRWQHVRDHVFTDGGPVEAWETDQFGEKRFIDAAETVHVAWESVDGNLGISPLQALGVTIRIEDAAQRAQTGMHENGWRQSTLITFPADVELDDDDLEEMEAHVRDTYGGADQAGAIGFLTGGADVKSFSMNADEAQLIEQRRVAREEVCAAYDMPPPIVGILDKATYSNIDTQRRMWLTDTLGLPLTLLEETIQAQLIDGEPAFEGLFVEFDLSGLLRGDPLAEIQAIREAVATGVLTPLEGRRILNRPPKGQPGEDDLYLPVNNLKPLGRPDPADQQ